jgi:hypothetical protein
MVSRRRRPAVGSASAGSLGSAWLFGSLAWYPAASTVAISCSTSTVVPNSTAAVSVA